MAREYTIEDLTYRLGGGVDFAGDEETVNGRLDAYEALVAKLCVALADRDECWT